MVNAFSRGQTLQQIGNKYGVTRQRVYQIINDINPNGPPIPPKYHRHFTRAKRKYLGFPNVKIKLEGGRDFIRELIRIRDRYTCQKCKKKWLKGRRRFDVHHADKKEEGKSHNKNCVSRDKKMLDRMITLCHKCHFQLKCVREKISKGRTR